MERVERGAGREDRRGFGATADRRAAERGAGVEVCVATARREAQRELEDQEASRLTQLIAL